MKRDTFNPVRCINKRQLRLLIQILHSQSESKIQLHELLRVLINILHTWSERIYNCPLFQRQFLKVWICVHDLLKQLKLCSAARCTPAKWHYSHLSWMQFSRKIKSGWVFPCKFRCGSICQRRYQSNAVLLQLGDQAGWLKFARAKVA